MCTLVVGLEVAGRGTVLAGANRDENPARPTAPPGILSERPYVAGGRDLVAGGTWLAVRERHALVAMLNRRPAGGDAEATEANDEATGAVPDRRPAPAERLTPRSRGLLALETASVDADAATFPERALAHVRAALAGAPYAPFTLALLAPAGSWVATLDRGADLRVERPGPGWHVLTHADLDDLEEPRTAALHRALELWRPADWEEARVGLAARLAVHDTPPVCIHDGPMPTVSSSIVLLGPGVARYAHADGRPCERGFDDLTRLLDAGPPPNTEAASDGTDDDARARHESGR